MRETGERAGMAARRLLGLFRDRQFIRFLVAGLVNTAVGYAAFLLALALCPTTFIALAASTVVAVLFNFASHGLYVFRSAELGRLWRYVLTYGLVFGFNAIGLALLERSGVPPQIGGLLLLPGAVLISYALNSRFVFVRRLDRPVRT